MAPEVDATLAATRDSQGRPRVVVTGRGLCTPAGQSVDALWSALLDGKSLAGPVTLFDAADHRVSIACEVRDFDPESVVGVKEARRTDRVALFALAAAGQALAEAGDLQTDPARVAVVAGSGIGGIRTLEDQVALYTERGPDRVSPFLVPMMMPNAAAATIAIHHGFTGPNLAVATACATGANAIGEGFRLIRDGRADVVVCGGTEACVSPVALAAFARMGALSKNPDAAGASRPFDVDRDGFVMGEGAGFVVLESLEHAAARSARSYGEVLGYAANCDAHHITAPRPDGAGAVACIEAALADAGVDAAQIGHVNAHGTSTPYNDAAEAEALAKVFGSGAVPVTSIKGVTGHLIGAAGAVEAIATLLSVEQGVVPTVANFASTDLPVDVVAGEPRSIERRAALSTSFAFGGHNAALVFGPINHPTTLG